MKTLNEKLSTYPSLTQVVSAVVNKWPEHTSYLKQRFLEDEPSFLKRSDDLARLILELIGNELPVYCEDYKWMCTNFVEEELYFRRNNTYRMNSFDQVNKEIYSDPAYMPRYVRGILLSQLFWKNHAQAIDCFRSEFLKLLRDDHDYLEIGPGHGLFLYFATEASAKSFTAFDVSSSSLKATSHALKLLKAKRDVNLQLQDVTQNTATKNSFDMIVISEVLEHLERPDLALQNLYELLKDKGNIYLNIPINSPAPDHIYLWRTPHAVRDMLKDIGFKIKNEFYYPATGYSLEKALKRDLTVSCVIFAQKDNKG